MNTPCTKCAAHLDARWSFCPHCGAANPGAAPAAAEPQKHEKSPVRNGFGGLLFGFLAAPVCIIVGIMLCLTGLGVFAGVPLIIAGICAPLIGSVLALNELKGKCPWCGAKIASIVNHTQDFACPACSRMITVHNRELVKAA